MKIEPTSELLSAYVDGELTADEQAVVERAMCDNPDVRRMHDELRALRFTLQSMPRFQPEEDLTRRIMRRAERTMLGASDATSQIGADESRDVTATPATSSAEVATSGGPWRSWSAAFGVIATLAALLLLALWLPNTADRQLARSLAPDATADAPTEESAHTEAETLREEQPHERFDAASSRSFEFGRGAVRDEVTDQPAREELALEGLASGPRGKGGGADGATAVDADTMEVTPALQVESRGRNRANVPEPSEAGEGQSYFRDESVAGKGQMGRSPARSYGAGAGFSQPSSGVEMPAQPADAPAVLFQMTDKQQLIDRLDADQIVYVELNLMPTEQEELESSVSWLEGKLHSAASAGVSFSRLQAGQKLRYSAQPHFYVDRLAGVDDVLVAEGSAEQIRAALVELSELDLVQIRLAESSATKRYAWFVQNRFLGVQPAPGAVRLVPDADDGQPEPSAVENIMGEPSAPVPPAASAGSAAPSGRQMRRQRRARGGASLAEKGQEMPGAGAGAGVGGGAGAAGKEPASAATPSSRGATGPARGTSVDGLKDEQLPGLPTQEKAKQLGDVAAGSAGSTDLSAPKRSTSGDKSATQRPQALGKADAKERSSDNSEQLRREAAMAGQRVAADQPATDPAASVGKPRLVRILFRITPSTGNAAATQMATPADAAGQPHASPDRERTPDKAADKE